MDKSVGSIIEKIKMQEQDMEAKLREKREYDATIASLKRTIRDANTQNEKSINEQAEITARLEKLRPKLAMEKIKRDALSAQLQAHTKELLSLSNISNEGVSNVWKLRSSLCETVQTVASDCDVWALLMRPVCPEPLLPVKHYPDEEKYEVKTDRLQTALQRRDIAQAERDRLLAEPDLGEEFVRIKNAVNYSTQKITELQKKYE